MFSLLFILYYSLLYRRETKAMTGFFTRHGMNTAHAEKLAWAVFMVQYLVLHHLQGLFLARSLF